ncbi:Thioredoxin-like fold [Phytophthora cactorum]|nr:Thioredoxin-like fold [Phytophthora cactorum]
MALWSSPHLCFVCEQKLYTYPGNYRAFKVLIAAEFNGIDIELPEFDFAKDIKSKEFKAKTPRQGPLWRRTREHLRERCHRRSARLRADTVFQPAALSKAKADVKKALQTLENHLHLRTYLVGEQVTLADIVVASALVYPFKFVLDKEFRKPYSAVNRWFSTLVNQPEFQAVKAAKKDAPKKEKAAPQEEAPKPKKVEHPLAVLNREKPSSLNLDAWKVQYSNTKNLADAMTWFWEHLDTEGYSLWFCDYNYNSENTKMFMTCNAVGGFLQRSEAMRKYAFGVMDVCGVEGSEIIITGCWLFRGDSEKHMIEANPDAEYTRGRRRS